MGSQQRPPAAKINGLEGGLGAAKMQEKKSQVTETIVLLSADKFFSFILNLPDLNQRLTRTESSLTKNEPSCRQLHLYGSADNLIPFQLIAMHMQERWKLGRKVFCFDFGSSPHVAHYRNFIVVFIKLAFVMLPGQVQTANKALPMGRVGSDRFGHN